LPTVVLKLCIERDSHDLFCSKISRENHVLCTVLEQRLAKLNFAFTN
jgi:hypothetical protein